MGQYSKRIWLNKPESSFTGSLVCFTGKPSYMRSDAENEVREPVDFIEVSDCHHKIRLHRGDMEHLSAFIDKLNVIIKELNKYVIFLESELENTP